MIETPGDTPVTMPVDELTTAAAVLLLLQVPQSVTSDNVVPQPVQPGPEPVMAAAVTATLTVDTEEQEPVV